MPAAVPHVDKAALLQLVRIALLNEPSDDFPSLSEQQWSVLFLYAVRHKIIGVIHEGMSKLPDSQRPPRRLWLRFCAERDRVEIHSRKRLSVLVNLSQFFDSMGIRTLVLKGAQLASFYPIPYIREYGDLDIYQFGDYRKGDALISKHHGIKVSNESPHHTKYLFQGHTVENHYDFLNTRAFRSNRPLESLLKHWIGEECSVSSISSSFYEPSARFNALFLVRHLAGHFAAGQVTVRDLCDWRMFLQYAGSMVDWTELYSIYRQYNMHHFVSSLQSIMEDYFALTPIPGLPREKSQALADRVLNDIIYGEFQEPECKADGLKRLLWKIRRFRANRWKFEIVYSDSRLLSILTNIFSHFLKPKSIFHKV